MTSLLNAAATGLIEKQRRDMIARALRHRVGFWLSVLVGFPLTLRLDRNLKSQKSRAFAAMKPRPKEIPSGNGCRPTTNTRAILARLTAWFIAALPLTAAAEKDLGDLSMEELMNESVTSVSKREQKLTDAPAAIAVLTNDDIRRSGATTIPDLLRLVPGVGVGAANSREWAVSARSFNQVFSNKQLVLVDGRAVYTSLFAGVYWDLQQTMLEDVDRIEVIRGPGATVWGANAVNGVINVVTRSAKDTQGGLLYGGAGDAIESMAGARYGGKIGENTYYRIFGSYRSTDDTSLANGQPANDHWKAQNGGFRVDHYPDPDSQVTWQADATGVTSDAGTSHSDNVNTLGRWTRRFSERSSIEVQTYYDRLYRNESTRSRPISDTYDIQAQHTFGIGERQDVIWGLGYRYIANNVEPTTSFITVRHGEFALRLYSAFIQDEFRIIPERLTLTAGIKLEHNDYTGFEFQPSVRAVLKPTASQTFWAAISRAVRTPDSVEGSDLFAITIGPPFTGPDDKPYLPVLVGNPALKSEVLQAYEAGYRSTPVKWASVDVAVFYQDYRDLIAYGENSSFFPGTPFGTYEISWANSLHGDVYGLESAITLSPSEKWRVIASYSLLDQEIFGPLPASLDLTRTPPKHQAVLRLSHDLDEKTSIDLQGRYVAAIDAVPAYFTADVHLSYRPNKHIEVSLVGQNLLDPHPEQKVTILTVTSEVPRSFYGKLIWRF